MTACVLGLSLASCSEQQPGSPRASDTTTGASPTTKTSSSMSTTTSTAAPSGSSPLAAIDPCGLLTDSERSQLGVAAGKPKKTLESKGCDWNKSGDFAFTVGLSPEHGVKDGNYHGQTLVPVTVGKREAAKIENFLGDKGSCDLFITITDTSSVQISATASGGSDTAKACAKALLAANIIDPKLP
jgi:hypothetical protein